MQCDNREIWKDLKIIKNETDAEFERLESESDEQLREEMEKKAILNTQLVLRRLLFGFEARWNEVPQPDSPDPGPARASQTTPEGFRLSVDNKYLDPDNATTLEELMAYMDSLLAENR